MDDFLTIEYLENAIKDIFLKGTTDKIIVSFPNEESYNKYMKEAKEQMRKEINKPFTKTKRSKKKIKIEL